MPEGFEDELSGEGATEFEDIEGGGIGDGEGAKDVSDQIENEDQVRLKFLFIFSHRPIRFFSYYVDFHLLVVLVYTRGSPKYLEFRK